MVSSFRGRTSLRAGNRPSAIPRSSSGIASRCREILDVTPQTTRSSPWTMRIRAGRRLTAVRSVKGNEIVTKDPGSRANRTSPHTLSQTSSSGFPQSSFNVSSEARRSGPNSSLNLLHIGLLAKDEGVPRFEKHEVRVPCEPVPLANFVRDHNLALAGHFHDVHRLARRVLLLKSCLG